MKCKSATTIGTTTVIAILALFPEISRADETGISFWLPGQFGSLAAAPGAPGWSVGAVYYHATLEASGNVAAAREIQVGRFPATVTSTGGRRSSSRSRFSLASSDMPINRSRTTAARARYWAASNRAFSE
jgi:hypothetical protein